MSFTVDADGRVRVRSGETVGSALLDRLVTGEVVFLTADGAVAARAPLSESRHTHGGCGCAAGGGVGGAVAAAVAAAVAGLLARRRRR